MQGTGQEDVLNDQQTTPLWVGADGEPTSLSRELSGYVGLRTRYFDHVLHFKKDVVEEHHLEAVTTVRPVIADVQQDWAAALLASGFNPGQRSVWLAEGLLFYLPPEGGAALLSTVIALSPAGGTLAVEYPAGDMTAVLEDISPTSATRDMISAFVKAGPQEPPSTWLGRKGWTIEAQDVARLAATLDRHPPSWSSTSGFSWWFATASWTGR